MSLLQFNALTFDVVGTLIDFERGMLDDLHAAAPGARMSITEPDYHFNTLAQLADAVEVEARQ